MSSALKNPYTPWWWSTLLAVFVAGGTTVHFITQRRDEASTQQLALRTDERDAARIQYSSCLNTATQTQNQVDMLRQNIAKSPNVQQLVELTQNSQQLSQNNQQLVQWNNEWRAANEKLKAQLNDSGQLAELKRQYSEASVRVVNFTNTRCAGAEQLGCDLTPLSQRHLKSLETQRDQLHAQVLDALSRSGFKPECKFAQ